MNEPSALTMISRSASGSRVVRAGRSSGPSSGRRSDASAGAKFRARTERPTPHWPDCALRAVMRTYDRVAMRNQLRPLFDRVVIKELDPDRIRRSGLLVPPAPTSRRPSTGSCSRSARVWTGGITSASPCRSSPATTSCSRPRPAPGSRSRRSGCSSAAWASCSACSSRSRTARAAAGGRWRPGVLPGVRARGLDRATRRRDAQAAALRSAGRAAAPPRRGPAGRPPRRRRRARARCRQACSHSLTRSVRASAWA